MHNRDWLDKFGPDEVLEQVASCACFEGTHHLNIPSDRRQNDKPCVRELLPYGKHRVHAVDVWHPKIHERYVRAVSSESNESLRSIRGLAYHLHISLLIDLASNSRAHQRMVIHDKHFDFLDIRHSGLPKDLSSRVQVDLRRVLVCLSQEKRPERATDNNSFRDCDRALTLLDSQGAATVYDVSRRSSRTWPGHSALLRGGSWNR